MKNIKPVLKFLLLLYIVTLVSCKKDEPENSAEDEQVFELTDYYIVGRVPATMSNGQTVQKPFIITFDEYGKAHMLREEPGTYSLVDGKLKIGYGMVFTIANKTITGYLDEYKRYPFTSYSLKKLPEKNQLFGNSYKGTWINRANTNATFTFKANTYDETNGAVYNFSGEYDLMANVAARSDTKYAASDNFARYELVLIDGKLEVTCFKPNVIGPNAEIATYGVFSKVP